MGLYKLCDHKGRARDRCAHAWWAQFRKVRVSLEKWANREIDSKTDAVMAFDDLKSAVRAGTFDKRGIDVTLEPTTVTFRQFAEIYKERHVFAKALAIGNTIDYRLRPIIAHFGDRSLAEIRTADVEDFIADLKKPKIAGRRKKPRTLSPASINRTIEIMRHMMHWAVGREYLERTPFRRGTETLIRKLPEDNRRRRRISEDEEARLLAAAPSLLRSMLITALDTGTRQGEMLALRFGDIDFARGLITLRGETTKSKKTRLVPIATARLRAVLEWLQLEADGTKKPDDALVFSDEAGEPVGRFRTAWVTTVLKAHGIKPVWKSYGWTALTSPCLAEFRRINLRWHDLRHEYASRLVEKGVPLAGARPPGPCIDHDNRALRQPEAGEPAGRSCAPRARRDVHSAASASHRSAEATVLPAKAGSLGSEAGRQERAQQAPRIVKSSRFRQELG